MLQSDFLTLPNFILGDCMEYMKEIPDKYFELAIVDPPYGIGFPEQLEKSRKANRSMFRQSKGGGGGWDDNIPPEDYFLELFRVSKNQIIWGGNYFIDYLKNTRCFIVWDKMNGTNPMADAELAWTSFSGSVRMFRMHHFSQGYDNKIHPTQKPTKLYKWLLNNYAKEGDKILDTHVGSASSLIACHELGFDYLGFEIDEEYYEKAKERLERVKAQQSIFDLGVER